jgi:hypothetical protein
MITTGAIFALAAPAAQASLSRTLPVKVQYGTHHKIVAKNHKVAAKSSAAKHKAGTGPLYILVPGVPNQASGTPSADDCATSGNNCTDQQLCDIWGENCDVVGAMTNDAPPVVSAPAASPQSAPTTNAAAAVDIAVSTDDNSDDC